MRRDGEALHDPELVKKEGISFSDIQDDLTSVLASQREFVSRHELDRLLEAILDESAFDRLSAPQRIAVKQNIRLLSLLSGHKGSMLRRQLKFGQTLFSIKLSQLLEWPNTIAKSGNLSFNETITTPLSDFLQKRKDSREVYEYLLSDSAMGGEETINPQTLSEHLCRSLHLVSGKSDADINKVLFGQRSKEIKVVLDTLGFIPHQLYKDSSFRTLEPAQVIAVERQLREIERTDPALSHQAREERTHLTQALFTTGIAKKLRTGRKDARYVTLDSNGVRIHFDGRSAGKGKPLLDRPFVSHIPYGLLSEECVLELEKYWLQGESEGLELRLRRAQENSDIRESQAKKDHQISAFSDRLGLTKETPELTYQALKKELVEFPDRFAKRVLDSQEIIPDQLLERLFVEMGEKGLFVSMRFAEAVTVVISTESLSNKHLFLQHGIRDNQKQMYQARSRVMNDPRYYNALKIVRAVLAQKPLSDADNQFLVFRGQYKKSNEGRQHSFLEVVHEGQIAKVLVDEQKEFKSDQLERTPIFFREVYEELEESLVAFDYFLGRIDQMRRLVRYKNKQWEQKFREDMKEAEVFVLTNVSHRYKDLRVLIDQLQTPEMSEQSLSDFLNVLEQAQEEYRTFLYKGATPELVGFRDIFRPSVRVHEIEYGQEFLSLATKMCPEWGFDKELSTESQSIRVIVLNHLIQHPSETIPVDVEEAVLDKLRINRNRPLINVVGGCKFVEDLDNPEEHPLNKMSLAVLDVAHEVKANVAVPGTQSGIGVYFGQQNVRYRRETEYLPFRERAHLFSISPGGNTVYPDNPWMEQTQSSERYAVAPVDTVVTPITALWGGKGEERLRGYDLHIAYMESLFARISKEQPRVLVAGNGGVFSILEINESIKHGFDILLIEDSGRFAEAASSVIREIDHLPDQKDPGFDEHVRLLLQATLPTDVMKEFFKKDFGETTPPEGDLRENYNVFRDHFRRFVALAKQFPEKVHVTHLDSLKKDIRAFVTRP